MSTGETTQANVSKHLTLMLEAGLIHRRKEGLNSYYRIADPGIFTLCEIVCNSIENNLLERMEMIREDKDEEEPVTRDYDPATTKWPCQLGCRWRAQCEAHGP